MGEPIIGPVEMGQKLVEALGLKGVPGIMKLQITAEAGVVPTLTIVRTITHEQAGNARALLMEWNCELVPKGDPIEREISADGSVSEARTPQFPSPHPRVG